MSAPPVTNAAPVISWADPDPTALSFTVSRGLDCSSLAQIDANATSPVTDSSLALNGSDDNSYCYEVESFDGADPSTSNLIDSGTATVVLDTTDPSVSFSAGPADGDRFSVAGADFSASASDTSGSGIDSVRLQRLIGATWTDVAGATDSTAPYDTVDLPSTGLTNDVDYQLRLLATDNAGNTHTSSVRTLTFDNVTAATTITAPASGAIKSGTFGISFTNGDLATPVTTTAKARLHGTTDTPLAQTGLTKTGWVTTAANDGDWDVFLSSQDAFANPAATDSVHVIVDNTDPTLTLSTFPADGAAVRGTVNTTFSASDATTAATTKLQYDDQSSGGVTWVDATTTPITGGLAWNTTGVADSDYSLRVLATDGAGNTTIRPSSAVVVTVDNTAPSAPVFATLGDPKNGTTYGRGAISVPYTGVSDSGSGIASVALQAQIGGVGPWVTKSTGTSSPLSWTPLPADDCTCSFRLLATDHAGNTSVTAVLRTMVKIDGFDPVAPGVFNIDRSMTNGPPKLTWSKSPSGDVAGYRIVRDTVVFPTGGALVPKTQLNYTDNSLLRDGTVDGPHGYALYAVDQSGNASVQKVVNFFLDSVPPTTPTSPHGARRTGKAIVDLRWAGSSDVVGPHQAPPSGVARYVVRRAVGAPPASVTAGQLACDVPAGQLACADTPPQGATYQYSIFAVDAASNASLAAHAGPISVPDVTPPGAPSGFKVRKKGLIMALSWTLPSAKDLKRIVIVKSSVRAPRTLTDGKVVFSGKAAKANVRQSGGTRAWYRTFAVDNAGNASAGGSLLITQPTFRLFPENGSEVRGSVGLRWKKSKRASYYNVQVYLGSKRVTQGWPKSARFKVAKSKLKRGKVYTWYVWPGVGAKSRGRYGHLIGKSTFTWLG